MCQALIWLYYIVHSITSKWKDTFTLILGIIIGMIVAFNFIQSGIEKELKAHKEETLKILVEIQREVTKPHPPHPPHPPISASQDSLILERVAPVDSCINRHFYRVNRRLSNLERALKIEN